MRVVSRWLKSGAFPDRLIPADADDRAFVMEVVYGVVRHRRLLQWVVDRCVERTPTDVVLAALLVGCYQLLFMNRVPAYAAVNETVAATGRKKPYAGFLNAVLRRVDRERDDLQREIRGLPLAVRQSHPDLLVERWIEAFGPEATEALCRWNNMPAEVSIRVTTEPVGINEFREQLLADGIETTPHPASPERFLVLPRGCSVPALAGYDEGRFVVQDPATAMAVQLLDPQPADRVLDTCAAPGGKAMLIAERLGPAGRLVAMDLHEDRLVRLRANLKRTQHAEVDILRGDAADPPVSLVEGEPFDRILLDVPCTNTGVIRRRADARWRFAPDRMAALARTQQRILARAAELLAPGGMLVYSTCSFEPEENEGVVHPWLAAQADFKLQQEWRSLPPGSHMDGAYAAVIRRV